MHNRWGKRRYTNDLIVYDDPLAVRHADQAKSIWSGLRPIMPCHRDDPHHAVGGKSQTQNGQQMAGKGELVFEGELLELPGWQ